MTKVLRGLVHLAAAMGLAAWALALGRWLRDPDPGGAVGLLVLLLLVALAIRRLYAPGGLAGIPRPPEPSTPLQGVRPPLGEGQTPSRGVEGSSAEPLFEHGVDLNSAGVEELVTLPGVGPVAARRILEEREARGPFASVESLTRVPGFGPAKVRSLADRVRV